MFRIVARLLWLGSVLLTSACATQAQDPLGRALAQQPALRQVLKKADEYRLQIVLGTVETDGSGNSYLKQYQYRVSNEYFYPASSVKLFAAVAAAETIERLGEQTGVELTLDTPLVVHPLFDDDVLEDRDEFNIDGAAITLRQQIRKIFLVSDNQAYNTLYELAGQDGIARSMQAAGLTGSRIVQRLSEFRTPAENRRYPRIDFMDPQVVYTLAERSSDPLPALQGISRLQVGQKYFGNGELHHEPMDFSEKNYVPLPELQRGLCKLVQPTLDCGGGPAFALTEDARDTMLEAMSQYPRQSRNPLYSAAEFPDNYVKEMLPGIARVIPREYIRIYNKTGRAYGFSIENAWVEDIRTGSGFFLAATLYTNSNGTLNDDQYDYDTIARPFMEALGEAVAKERWVRKQ